MGLVTVVVGGAAQRLVMHWACADTDAPRLSATARSAAATTRRIHLPLGRRTFRQTYSIQTLVGRHRPPVQVLAQPAMDAGEGLLRPVLGLANHGNINQLAAFGELVQDGVPTCADPRAPAALAGSATAGRKPRARQARTRQAPAPMHHEWRGRSARCAAPARP